MANETTDLVFRYIMEHKDCRARDIANAIKTGSQLVNYHLEILVNKGIVIKKGVFGVNIYSCALADDEARDILSNTDGTIKVLYERLKLSGSSNPKEVTKQLIGAYIDALLD